MSDGVRVDIIYFNTPSDWLFESELYSKQYSLRLLTSMAASRMEALKNLSRAVSRSETVILVGGWQGEVYLPAVVAKAVGLNCQKVGLSGWTAEQAILLPSGSIPLTQDGRIRGAILCRGPQAIVMIDDERDGRVRLEKEFVVPYLMKQAGAAPVQSKPRPEPEPVPKAEPVQAVKPAEPVRETVPEVKTVQEKVPEPQRMEPKPVEEAVQPVEVSKEKPAPRKVNIETIPMKSVRLKPAKTSATGLPKLKFDNSLSDAPGMEKKPESVKLPEEIVMTDGSESIDVQTVEPPVVAPPIVETPAVKMPVVERQPRRVRLDEQMRKSTTKPIEEELSEEDEGIDLPRFGKVLTVVLVLLLLLGLGAALFAGYHFFVLDNIPNAVASVFDGAMGVWI